MKSIFQSNHRSRRNKPDPQNEQLGEQQPFFGGKEASQPFIQPKLTVGQPDDAYEQEADAVADQVVSADAQTTPTVQPKRITPLQSGSLQRLATPEEDKMPSTNDERMAEDKRIQEKAEPGSIEEKKDEPIQMMAASEEKEEPIQMMGAPEGKEEDKELQTKTDGQAGSHAHVNLSTRLSARKGAGAPLPAAAKAQMEQGIGSDFSDVRVHTDSEAADMNKDLHAQAFTHGQDIYFNSGKFNPESKDGQKLLAHELTHVVQQGGGQGEAVQRSPLSDKAKSIWTDSMKNKGRIFDFLRANSPNSDVDLSAFIQSIFQADTDDRWLAETIIKNGPEPLWPLSDIKERQNRAMTKGWAPEAGNIAATLGATQGHQVEAFYFRGISDRRALIIGGVHGSEVGGVEAVHNLLQIMRQPNAPMPFFSVIIVPELFAGNVKSKSRTTGGKVKGRVGGKAKDVNTPDPNRQFPAIGADPSFNTVLGCTVDEQQRCIEPENLVLLDLVNRFQPERVASVHGHSVVNDKAKIKSDGAASITTDPRPGKEKEDDALALAMAQEAHKRKVAVPGNFIGTKDQTTRYPTGTAPTISKGVTFGQWGSHATSTRPAMNIILIETQGNRTSATGTNAEKAARKTELMNFAEILRSFFLEDPAKVTPPQASGGNQPTKRP